jgi:hypothetical protein
MQNATVASCMAHRQHWLRARLTYAAAAEQAHGSMMMDVVLLLSVFVITFCALLLFFNMSVLAHTMLLNSRLA